MANLQHTFGERHEPHTIILARGERVRHVTIGHRTLLTSVALSVMVLLGLAATPVVYLTQIEHEQPVAADVSPTALAYEQRIAALRAQLDRITSRQILSQKVVETKVDALLDQQEQLSARYAKLQPLMERAEENGILGKAIPRPEPRPEGDSDTVDSIGGEPKTVHSEATGSSDEPTTHAVGEVLPVRGTDDITTGSIGLDEGMGDLRHALTGASNDPSFASKLPSEAMIREIGRSIDIAELRQIEHLQKLTSTARSRASRLATMLAAAGIPVSKTANAPTAEGGPYEPVPVGYNFEQSYAALDVALDDLQRVRNVAVTLPLTEPMPHRDMSSPFGVRPDPFLGRPAFHAGIDYAMPSGTNVTATAPGTVIHAGPAGGYGNMVEVDVGHGLTTRYGHLSRIDVSVGDRIDKGGKIGGVGTTGRSTGPHLHYEIRRNGEAVDPGWFYRLGDKIGVFS